MDTYTRIQPGRISWKLELSFHESFESHPDNIPSRIKAMKLKPNPCSIRNWIKAVCLIARRTAHITFHVWCRAQHFSFFSLSRPISHPKMSLRHLFSPILRRFCTSESHELASNSSTFEPNPLNEAEEPFQSDDPSPKSRRLNQNGYGDGFPVWWATFRRVTILIPD